MDYEAKLRELDSQFGDWWNHGFEIPEMTNKLYPYKNMFSPITVNKLTLKNRLVMAPMGNINMCDETGRPNDKMLKYFEERAKGGVGLITTGLIPVSYGIDKSIIELDKLTYFPRIDRSRTVQSGWRNLTAMVHAHGAHIFVQLTAGLGRVGNPQCLVNQFKFPRSASFNPNWYMSDVPCLRLSDRSLRKIIKRIGQGAADAKAFNLDGVYIHGHEGYLFEQLANPAFNRRVMGKYADYERFGIETVEEIRKRTGPDYPIMYRIDLSLMLEATYKENRKKIKELKKFKDERTIQETLEYMAKLVKAGVDMFDVDLGCYDNWWLPHPPSSMPPGCYLEIAEIAKKYLKDNGILSNKGLEVPVVAVGKLGYPDLAEKALIDEKCDMVMLGRPLLADPDWCNKAYAGNTESIRPCIGCQEACINEFVEGGHPQCAVNPRTSFEHEFSAEIPRAKKAKKVAVVGGGPAGIVASKVLIARGHIVDLFEKDERLGGNLIAGSIAKIKYEIKNYLSYLEKEVEKLKENPNFTLHLGTAATLESLKEGKYDVIITATGSNQVRPSSIEGINNKNVVTAVDLFRDPSLLGDAKNAVVIGGGVVGAEAAYWLKYEHGVDVKVVEMDKYIMNHTCTANRGHIIHYLNQGEVELLNCTKLDKIVGNTVYVTRNTHKNVPNPYNTWSPILPVNVVNPLDVLRKIKDEPVELKLETDIVVLAMGVRSANKLYFDCLAENVAPEIYNLGDSFKGAKIFEATRSAYRKARII
ncbi:MAG TPA: FAD-dependent oxidoreductase [Clostridia bacterium]|jgi:2-enoate reductase|nr:FAD-dependent oxidoreductase [Clostridia bacterium]